MSTISTACACVGPPGRCPCVMKNGEPYDLTPEYWARLAAAIKAAPKLPPDDRSNDPEPLA